MVESKDNIDRNLEDSIPAGVQSGEFIKYPWIQEENSYRQKGERLSLIQVKWGSV